jgi:UDPglucose--hexose-1-phosphate uridylyltransferase
VAIAPGRALRPGADRAHIEPVTQEELDECPFCAGREDRTPPETLRIPERGEWLVRVVPNLYPAVAPQDVVVHSPRHVRSFAELSDEEIAAVAEAWNARVAEGMESGFDYVQALINEGRQAGSSLAHSHSQLVYLREPPPIAQAELEQDGCGVCEVLGRSELLVAEDNGVKAVAHPAGRLPYELLIAESSHELDLASALMLTRDAVRRLRAVEGPVPWNAWVHQTDHPHLELVPRLTVLAGLELGAGIYVNSLDPAEAAQRLRNA